MPVTHKPKSGARLTGTEYEAADAHILALADGDIPSTIARDSEVTSAISALSSVYQPLDSDLTSIAALTTTAFGRGLLELADQAALLAAAGAAASGHNHSGTYQPADADLTALAGLTSAADKVPYFTGSGTAGVFDSTAYGRGLINLADQAALQSAVGFIDATSYGVTANGTTDDTTALQAAIDATPAGGRLLLPSGTMKITAALDIDKDLTVVGQGVSVYYGSAEIIGTMAPSVSPWLRGSVIVQSTAATDAIQITGNGQSVNLRDFGIRFADAIAFSDTGHGIITLPGTRDGNHDSGPTGCSWQNLIVFGHDGDHYAYHVLNPLYWTASGLQSYGGGGYHIECDSTDDAYGNAVLTHPTCYLLANGTAHGFHLKSRTSVFPGKLNMVTFVRPQCIALDATAWSPYSGFTFSPPDSDQYLWRDEGDPQDVLLIAPDLETIEASACPISWGTGTYTEMAGSFISDDQIPAYRMGRARFDTTYLTDCVTLTAGNSMGTGGSLAVGGFHPSTAANDERGKLTITTGTGAADWGANGAAVCTVSLPYRKGIGSVVFQPVYPPGPSFTAQFYPKIVSATSFEIWTNAGVANSTEYGLNYIVLD